MSPYDVLGVTPDADVHETKRAHRKLAMLHHPDRNQGDPGATDRMTAINAAFETIMRLRSQSIPPCFHVVVAIAGAGKTRRLSKHLSGLQVTKTVVAVPTLALLAEVAAWLKGAIAPVEPIHSHQGSRSVSGRLARWFEAQEKDPDPRGGILLCSHAAILECAPHPDYNLVLDEVPEVYEFQRRQFARCQRLISRLLRAGKYCEGVKRLYPEDSERLKHIARNYPYGELDAVFQSLAQAVLDPHRWVLVLADQWEDLVQPYSSRNFAGELDVLILRHPAYLQKWKSVTWMGARADRTMAHLLWSRLFNQNFRSHSLQTGLPDRHRNGGRLTLRYFFEGRATRTMLGKPATGGGTMQSAMCRATAAHFAGRPFLWSLPQPRDDGGVRDRFWSGEIKAFDPGLRLPGRSFGMNQWRQHVNLALLSVVNLSGEQQRLLSLLGLEPEAVFDAFTITILYQDLMRGNLRVAGASRAVECVLPDRASAMALAAEFPGCKVEQLDEDQIPQPVAQRRGPKPTGTAMSPAERKRKQRAAERVHREAASQALKENA